MRTEWDSMDSSERNALRRELAAERTEGECSCGPTPTDPMLGPNWNDDPYCPLHGDDREDEEDE